jgi:hypothetical protein
MAGTSGETKPSGRDQRGQEDPFGTLEDSSPVENRRAECREDVRSRCSGIRLEYPHVHNPEPNDCAHSGIYGTNQNHELIAELITETIQEIHPAN